MQRSFPKNVYALSDVVLLSVGRQACPSGHKYDGWRDHFVLHHIVRGRGVFKYKNSVYHLGAGESFLIEPHQANFYQADEHDPWEYLWIVFKGGSAVDIIRHTNFNNIPAVRSPRASAITEIMEKLFDLSASMSPQALLRIYSDLFQLFSHFAVAGESDAVAMSVDYVTAAKEFIRTHYQDPIRTQDVAGYLGLERSYFSHLFKLQTGIGPAEYLRDYRLKIAGEMLLTTNLSITQVFYSAGFRDYYAFMKLFKRSMGMTPLTYRTRAKLEDDDG